MSPGSTRWSTRCASASPATARSCWFSSGAIGAGLAPLSLAKRPRDLASQQAAASVGQLALAHAYAESFGRYSLTVGQLLLTSDDVVRRAHYRNAQRTFDRLLALGAVPVVNENDTVATEEIRFGDNDRLAALVAHLIGADALVLLSDVDALYDGDPRDGATRKIAEVNGPSDVGGITVGMSSSGLGIGGMVSKLAAARTAAGAGIPVLLASAADAGKALASADIGTAFAADSRLSAPPVSGSATRPTRAASSSSTTARSLRSSVAGHCWRRVSSTSRAISRQATSSISRARRVG